MSLVQTYLDTNGYDYYGNAAEDTLVFFVHEEQAPGTGESGNDNEETTNMPDTEVNNLPASGSLDSVEPYADSNDFGDSIPKMAELDTKQTDTEHSTDADFKA